MEQFLLVMILLGVLLIAISTETILYLCKTRWYFAAGPVVLRQRWQTRMSMPQAAAAIEGALHQDKLAWQQHGNVFAIRRPWWEFSTYPRIALTPEPAAEGIAIVYEVKPFLSAALFAIPFPVLIRSANAHDTMVWYSLSALVICAYVYFFAWELRRLHGVDVVRKNLASAGVRVCTRCGYDLFGLEETARCPECGTEH